MGRVLIPQKVDAAGERLLAEAGHEIVIPKQFDETTLIDAVRDCDAILLRTAAVGAAVLQAGKKLQIVARHGAGYNNVDVETASELGIWVTNTPDATTMSVAEFTLGAIIACAKQSFRLNKALLEDDFYRKNRFLGQDLSGKTLSIIGLGRIGREVAKRAYYGLGMRVIAYSPHIPADLPPYIEAVSRDEAFAGADFVSLHMPLTNCSRASIGANEFLNMKPEAFLINCARGEVIVEAELIQALEAGRIAGAFLDVFEQEPPEKDNPLLHMEQVIVTPHMASNTKECMRRMAVGAASEIVLVLDGKAPKWPVNQPAELKKK
ncbi:MAG: hydroxyacid dehydrogenase [Eubacteriales bacterium]|nr:hydroxyacid dehydrogenase [Eubacteriales bacterium]